MRFEVALERNCIVCYGFVKRQARGVYFYVQGVKNCLHKYFFRLRCLLAEVTGFYFGVLFRDLAQPGRALALGLVWKKVSGGQFFQAKYSGS